MLIKEKKDPSKQLRGIPIRSTPALVNAFAFSKRLTHARVSTIMELKSSMVERRAYVFKPSD